MGVMMPDEWELYRDDISDEHVTMTFYIALEHDKDIVKELESIVLDHISNIDSFRYGDFFTPEEINEMLAAPIEDRDKVYKWFLTRDIKCQDLSDALKCTGSIRDINNALKVQVRPFQNLKTEVVSFTSVIACSTSVST